ncbi:hypothetical protein [Rhodocyclus tenuis]|uniref:Uncharacterized protein n=1 Tax=Rhodocyclus tenuis TaxID=1066 RepID=A0A840G978_RHOTE|nr:hypothetical protein [Rhodocyclus tenuis]MBB4247238.1 hypothetical protein [Rhodocyclus tenuis]
MQSILIILVLFSGPQSGSTIAQVAFQTPELCEVARVQVGDEVLAALRQKQMDKFTVSLVCTTVAG